MNPGLLTTKIRPPAVPHGSVARPRLIARLQEGLRAGRPVTLVSAQAGSGKSTLVAQWLERLERPAAWLSLDPADDDPGRFFTYFFAALQTAAPGLGREIASALQAGQLPPAETICAALVNELFERAQEPELPILLVIDDLQFIQEPFILRVLEMLLANPPRAAGAALLHLVLLTREDPALPLARLRASGQLTEIRADDLRFSAEEAGSLLNQGLNLSLSADEIAALEDRTEGWAVGLQLAGLSIRGRDDPARFIHGLRGSQRFILSYLTEEVLNRQPAEIQEFLLATAILDRLNGGLCDAVTGRGDSLAVLEQLRSANLFLVPLDDDWFRYHHLFGDLLRSRQRALRGEQTAELHRRASRWYARQADPAAGTAGSSDERAACAIQAVEHALAAADYPFALALIERHTMEMINQWYARTVEGWIKALPAEWSAQSPRANLAFAQMHLIRGEFPLAMPYLARLQAIFGAAQPGQNAAAVTPGLRAEWLALQSTMLAAQGSPEQALALAQQALALAPESDSSALIQVNLALAVAYQGLNDTPNAEEAYQRLIQLGRSTANLTIELLGISALGLMYIERGRLHDGYALAAQGAERAERAGVLPPICAGLYGELGQIAYLWNQPEQAEQFQQRAEQLSALGTFSDAGIFHAVMRSRLALARGDLPAAAHEIDRAAGAMQSDAPLVVREEVIAQRVRVWLMQGELAAAEQFFAQATGFRAGVLPDFDPQQSLSYKRTVLYISALRFPLYRALQPGVPAADLSGALALAGRLLNVLERHGYVPLALETLLVRAQLHQAAGEHPASLADYRAALDLAAAEGYLSPFVVEGQPVAQGLARLRAESSPGSPRAEQIAAILAAFPGQPAPPTARGLPETLTARELDVLRQLAAGQTYEEIAAAQVVSINTVRSHVKAIYGKLGAKNRTAAVEAAKKAGLL